MTVLVFFAAAAGTGIVAAGFFLDMHGHRLLFFGLSRLCRSLHARSLQLIDIDFGSLLAFALYVLGRILPYRDVGLVEGAQYVGIDFVEHFREELERLEFVDQQRVFLFVGGVLHALAQVVHFAQVLAPCVVDRGEHHHLGEYLEDLLPVRILAALQVHRDVVAQVSVRDGEVDIGVQLAFISASATRTAENIIS